MNQQNHEHGAAGVRVTIPSGPSSVASVAPSTPPTSSIATRLDAVQAALGSVRRQLPAEIDCLASAAVHGTGIKSALEKYELLHRAEIALASIKSDLDNELAFANHAEFEAARAAQAARPRVPRAVDPDDQFPLSQESPEQREARLRPIRRERQLHEERLADARRWSEEFSSSAVESGGKAA